MKFRDSIAFKLGRGTERVSQRFERAQRLLLEELTAERPYVIARGLPPDLFWR